MKAALAGWAAATTPHYLRLVAGQYGGLKCERGQ